MSINILYKGDDDDDDNDNNNVNYGQRYSVNPWNTKLNRICHLLALLGAHTFLHVSRVRVKVMEFLKISPCLFCNSRKTHVMVTSLKAKLRYKACYSVCHTQQSRWCKMLHKPYDTIICALWWGNFTWPSVNLHKYSSESEKECIKWESGLWIIHVMKLQSNL